MTTMMRPRQIQLVWAGGLDVSWLLALVADALRAGFRRTVTAQMTNLSTVVAFLPLSAVAGHVTVATARIAGLTALSTATTVSAAVPCVAVPAGSSSIPSSTTIGAVTSNVSDLATLVALLASTARIAATLTETSSWGTTSTWIWAVTRNMTGLATAVTGLFLLRLGTFAAHMAFPTAIIARRGATLGTVASLMRGVAAVIATASTWSLVIHVGEGLVVF